MYPTDFNVDKKKLQVTIRKAFNAPIDAVWQTHVDPDIVAKWWGPRDLELHVEKLDVQPGGQWRILHKDTANGKEHWFHGEYKEVDKPRKIVRTFVYEPVPDQVMTEVTTFEKTSDGLTKLTTISQFPSLEALDAMVNVGMEYGSRQSIDRLAGLLG